MDASICNFRNAEDVVDDDGVGDLGDEDGF
jgi:hypothetical protein